MSRHDRHLTDEQLVACYFAEDGDLAAEADRGHTAMCEVCAQRYAELARDLEQLADAASGEADAVFTPELLTHQRGQIMKRLEGQGRRAHIFVFPTLRSRGAASRTALKRPARWVAAAAAAGLTVGLGLGFSVERLRVNHFQDFAGQVVSRTDFRVPAAARWQADPRFEGTQVDVIVNVSDDELLEEIDTALVTRRAQELRALDALTPENTNISLRRR